MDLTVSTTLGILGAGRVGTAIAREALTAGYDVLLAASGDPAAIELIAKIMAPGARPVTAAQAVGSADLVILALPYPKYDSLDPDMFRGRTVIDAMNYWSPTDGAVPALEGVSSSSELVARHLAGARVVKTLNHIGYHELATEAASPGTAGRRALAVAGDDDAARQSAMQLIDRLGFDPVDAGPLFAGVALEPGTDIFSGRFDSAGLMAQLQLSDSTRAVA